VFLQEINIHCHFDRSEEQPALSLPKGAKWRNLVSLPWETTQACGEALFDQISPLRTWQNHVLRSK